MKKIEKNEKNFKKVLDKSESWCYNMQVASREVETEEKIRYLLKRATKTRL